MLCKMSRNFSESNTNCDNICFPNNLNQSEIKKCASCSQKTYLISNIWDDSPPKIKKQNENNQNDGNIGINLMKNTGDKDYLNTGEGLGENSQKTVNPMKSSTQKGCKGLGFASEKPTEFIGLDWTSTKNEPVEILKVTNWLKNKKTILFSFEEIIDWIKIGEKDISDQTTQFVDSTIFKTLKSRKHDLDAINIVDFKIARSKTNPFEEIKNGLFQNRAAMKMANIDWACNFMFTTPRYSDGTCMQSKHSSLLYFADICAGPGGFSEYVLWRKGWKAKGVGFTLQGVANDFKLENFYDGLTDSFEPFYGVNDDGNIYEPKNIISIENFVKNMTKGKGVHFVMADGGLKVEAREKFQEMLSKRLFLCQVLVALSILRPEGHFVCKFFDMFTEFSAGLFFLLHNSFKEISIYKPVTSRPENSERYIICKWRLNNILSIKRYLMEINLRWNYLENKEVISIVPLLKLQQNSNFFNYLYESNNNLGLKQAYSLSKLVKYNNYQILADLRQHSLKDECLTLWGMANDVRRLPPTKSDPQIVCDILITGKKDFLSWSPEILNIYNLKRYIKSAYDWYCVVLNHPKPPSFFMSCGKFVYEYVQNHWILNEHLNNISMSSGTLVYGELVYELEGEELGQLSVKVFHIIDAYKLGNINISEEHYLSRIEQCKSFVKSMNKIQSGQIKIKVKEPVSLKNIRAISKRTDLRFSKFHRKSVYMYILDNKKYYCASGIFFIKATLSPWVRALSTTYNMMYYGHPNEKSVFEKDNPMKAYAHFKTCCKTNKIWYWIEETGSSSVAINKKLIFNHFISFIP